MTCQAAATNAHTHIYMPTYTHKVTTRTVTFRGLSGMSPTHRRLAVPDAVQPQRPDPARVKPHGPLQLLPRRQLQPWPQPVQLHRWGRGPAAAAAASCAAAAGAAGLALHLVARALLQLVVGADGQSAEHHLLRRVWQHRGKRGWGRPYAHGDSVRNSVRNRQGGCQQELLHWWCLKSHRQEQNMTGCTNKPHVFAPISDRSRCRTVDDVCDGSAQVVVGGGAAGLRVAHQQLQVAQRQPPHVHHRHRHPAVHPTQTQRTCVYCPPHVSRRQALSDAGRSPFTVSARQGTGGKKGQHFTSATPGPPVSSHSLENAPTPTHCRPFHEARQKA